jgi:serine/threonine-protein kinase
MELLEGESLAARLRNVGRLPHPEARRIAAQTASALAAAHAAGIVHRDLKPDNLYLVPDDRDASLEMVKVLDFGIAKLGQKSNNSSVRTRTGSVMGTPAYMSPEQCRGTRQIDHRADIYALGVILYEMVCGRPPFVSEGFGEMVHLHISEPPPEPRTIEPSVPEDLERLILWCLAKEPNDRLESMTDLHAALTGRPTPPRITATARTRVPVVPANPTTFTHAAAQTGAPGTEVLGRSKKRRISAVAIGLLAIGGLAWLTRGTWMPGPGNEVTVAPATRAPANVAPAPPVAPAKVKTVTAAIVSTPPGARVVREKDGAVIGMTPFRETWPSGDGVLQLRLEIDGFRPEPVVVPLDRGVDLTFALRKAAQPEPQKHKGSKHTAPGGKAPATPTAPKPPSKSEPVPL